MDEITLKLNSQQNYKNNIETNKPNSNKKLKELKEISNQFESIFINQILKQARQNKIENTRKYPLCGYILGALMHITAADQH